MKIRSCDFVLSCVKKDQYPDEGIGDVAFAGRSNVGKSSIINMLLNRKKMAKTSSRPGKTQLINYFRINKEFFLVDLPGYGYARVSKANKATWGKIIETYLTQREELVEVVLLVDIRHKPTEQDIQMYNWIKDYGFRGLVVATKFDKIKRSQKDKQIKLIRNTLGMEKGEKLIVTSSQDRTGKEELWDAIAERFHDAGYEVANEDAGQI